ncbi:MAG: hypothetical protein NC393_10285 [Clostridium sp.]|nr:hypothetical protein [Clostridium sp.]MCM1207490.1 hypothetical protein [Ruminococcus sp.]
MMDFITTDELLRYDVKLTSDVLTAIRPIQTIHRSAYGWLYNMFRPELYYMLFMVEEDYKVLGFFTYAIMQTPLGAEIVVLQREVLDNDGGLQIRLNQGIEYVLEQYGISLAVAVSENDSVSLNGFSDNVRVFDIDKV